MAADEPQSNRIMAEGNRRPHPNNLKHGCTSATLLLPGESKEEFDSIYQEYVDMFLPAGPEETAIVREMALARWRLKRVWRVTEESREFPLKFQRYETQCYNQLTKAFECLVRLRDRARLMRPSRAKWRSITLPAWFWPVVRLARRWGSMLR